MLLSGNSWHSDKAAVVVTSYVVISSSSSKSRTQVWNLAALTHRFVPARDVFIQNNIVLAE